MNYSPCQWSVMVDCGDQVIIFRPLLSPHVSILAELNSRGTRDPLCDVMQFRFMLHLLS